MGKSISQLKKELNGLKKKQRDEDERRRLERQIREMRKGKSVTSKVSSRVVGSIKRHGPKLRKTGSRLLDNLASNFS